MEIEVKKEEDDGFLESIIVKEEYNIQEDNEIDHFKAVSGINQGLAVTQFEISEIEPNHKERKKKHKCPFCDKFFTKPSIVRAHVLTHTQERNFHCDQCFKSFSTKDSLVKHQRTHVEGVMHPCSVCLKEFKNLDYLRRHQRRHNSIRHHECGSCGKVFLEKTYLNRHIMIIHEGKKRHECLGITKKPKICGVCGKLFREKIPYERHIAIHSDLKNVECPLCPKKFKHYADLNRHSAIHRTDKPHSCEICKATFSRREYLRTHSLTHMNKCIKCPYCVKEFTRTEYVKGHIKRRHRGLPLFSKGDPLEFLRQFQDTPVSCTICKEPQKNLNDLTRHISEVHPKKRKFECELCKRQFHNEAAVKRHQIKMHES